MCRANTLPRPANIQTRQPVLSAGQSLMLYRAALLIAHVTDDCEDEQVAQLLDHMFERLHRIIADNYKRREKIARADPRPFALDAERLAQQETARLAREFMETDIPLLDVNGKPLPW